MTIAGWLIGLIAAQGLDLGIDTTTLAQVITAIIFLALGYLDAKYPNNFKFLHDDQEEEYPEVPLNEDYEV